MNQVVSTTPTYEYLRLDFKVTRSLIETAMTDSDELRVIIAKVMCYSLIIFALIAIFEAVVINGIRLVLNAGIWVLNTSNSLLFSPESPGLLEPPPVPVPPQVPVQAGAPAIQVQILDEPMPPLLASEEEEFRKVFKILATANYLELAWQRSYLIDFRERTKHIHPLQVMGFMLEQNSEQREHAALFFDRGMVRSTFIDDTLAGFANPLHADKTVKYIASFADKAGISPDAARGFLFQKPPLLKDLVFYILRQYTARG